MFATRPCAFISFATGHLRTLDATGRSSRLLLVVRIGLKIVVLFFSFPAQGHIVFAQTSSTLQNPELRRLASSLPARALQSKAPRTIDQYSRSFQKFRVWASCFPEIYTALPTRPLDAALYLVHLIQSDTGSSVLHSASCGISWANKLWFS